MKGVSAIIATILLLMITIGLAGTAYVYISGMMTGKMSKAISVLDVHCTGDPLSTKNNITIVISNDGTDSIATGAAGDLKILVNNMDKTGGFTPSTNPIAPRGVGIFIDNTTGYANRTSHTVLIISPSNSITQKIWC